MIGTMSYALTKYFLTKNKLIAGDVHAWVTPATLWPTILLLTISVITFVMDLFTVITYCCGVGAANKVSSVTNSILYIMMIVRVVVWAVSAGLFKMGQTSNSLWGYSCSNFADQIHNQVISFVDFGKLCTLQVSRYRYFFMGVS
jgi:hypothetical protein